MSKVGLPDTTMHGNIHPIMNNCSILECIKGKRDGHGASARQQNLRIPTA